MLKFVTFAVKMQLNVHDLNNEAVAGNVTDIRIMEFLDEAGNKLEAPAVSGRMLKHWHYEGMKRLIVNGSFNSVPLCAGCKAGEPIRPGELRNGNLTQVATSEDKAITSCAVCDIHGYLIAREAEGEGERGTSARRISRAMFSWLMPALDKIRLESDMGPTSKQVIHNRVSSNPSVMMPFNKSYASGIYAFVSALDVDRIGLVELNLGGTSSKDVDNKEKGTNLYAVDDNERKERIKVAIEASRFMLSGQIGASLSHAIPHTNPVEILVAYSENGPLPFPVSPMYSDYIPKTVGLMPQKTTILYWGSESPGGVMKKNTIEEIFTELLGKV